MPPSHSPRKRKNTTTPPSQSAENNEQKPPRPQKSGTALRTKRGWWSPQRSECRRPCGASIYQTLGPVRSRGPSSPPPWPQPSPAPPPVARAEGSGVWPLLHRLPHPPQLPTPPTHTRQRSPPAPAQGRRVSSDAEDMASRAQSLMASYFKERQSINETHQNA